MGSVNFKGVEPQINRGQEQKDEPGFFKKIGAGVIGSTVAAPIIAGTTIPTALFVQNRMVKLNRPLAKDEVQILNKAGEKILSDSGLAEKGVKILRDLPDDMKSVISRSSKMKNGFFKFFKMLNPVYQIKLGRNACFRFETNEVIATNKIALSQFHELGHAMNSNIGKFGRFLQNIRLDILNQIRQSNFQKVIMGMPVTKLPLTGKIAGLAATSIALVSIFKNKKAEGEKAHGFFDKTTTFIKDNVGKLTFLTMLPIVLEEGLASLKGEKAVKGLISKDLFKKVKISNRLGLLTYATAAVVTGFGAYLATKVRDKIAQPNLNK